MDHTLFSALLKNLLSVDVTDATDMDSSLYAFEKKYCFSIKMQPMFTSKALYYLLSSSKEMRIRSFTILGISTLGARGSRSQVAA